MKTRQLSVVAGVLGLVAGSAGAAPNDYAAITNMDKGAGQCLTLEANGRTVSLAACNGSAAQQWKFPASGPFFMVRNAAADAQGKNMCLRTYSDGATGAVELGACAGDGYTSMRQWVLTPGIDGSVALSNKFRSDQRRDEALAAVGRGIATVKEGGEVSAKWRYAGQLPFPSVPVLGTKKVLLMVTHYNGHAPADAEAVRKAVLGDGADHASLRHYLEQASNGKLTLQGTLLKDINLGDEPASCDPSAMITRARNAATAQGVRPDDFDYLFVDLSNTRKCSWAANAQNPGHWILSNAHGYKYWMWTHEFGHNLGVLHPDTLRNCPTENGVVELGARCQLGATDDPTDTVGGGGRRQYPVDYQLYAGWLKDAEVPVIQKAGQYQLAPLWRHNGAGSQGYRIVRSDGSFLVLEYRQPQSGFEDWSADSPFVNGVTVRVMRYQGFYIKNTLVDATPGSAAGMNDAPLMPGKSLHDELSGKWITVVSANSDGAVIRIDDTNPADSSSAVEHLSLSDATPAVSLPAGDPGADISGPTQARGGDTVTLDAPASNGTSDAIYHWTVSPPTVRDQSGGNYQGKRVVLKAPYESVKITAKLSVYAQGKPTSTFTHTVQVTAK